jgi:BioD-like phosphotransacetylase family protein
MNTLMIAAVDKESGKTVVALGIALNHPGKVEYLKPIRGRLIKVDQTVYERDARLVRQVLNLEGSDSDISPIDLEPDGDVDVEALVDRMRQLAGRSDMLLVETGQVTEEGLCHGASAFDLAAALGVDLVLVSDADPCHLDSVLLLKAFAESKGVGIAGVIVNNAKDGELADLLRSKDIPVLGNVPFEPRLRWFRTREILDEVGGECVAGSKGLDNMVENVVIGAMTAETALPLLRRIPGKCVITGGDRTDLQLAALTTDTACLVLTGGIRPNSRVMAEAHEKGVPVIVISGHTYQVAERFESLESRLNPFDEAMIEMVRDLIRDNVELERLYG